MKSKFVQRRDFSGLEERRMKAGKMFAKDMSQADIARKLGVSAVSVCRWHKEWVKAGSKGLKAAGRAGRLPRLNKKNLQRLDQILRKGPLHHGFATNLWTLPRIASVIEKETGVKYHPGHVWKLLGQLNWSLQRPARRAKQRNEEGILQWVKKTWPAIKKKPSDKKPGSSSKTSPGLAKSRRSEGPGRPKERHQS
jgi:transposase